MAAHKIDTADSRLLDVVFRDGQLWASGNDSCQPSGDTTQRSCLQFFEVLTGGVSPVVNQDFSFGTKNFFDYYPSVDLDSSDDLITSFSQSSSTEFPSAYVDGRLLGDPVNTLGTPVLFQAGAELQQNVHDGSQMGRLFRRRRRSNRSDCDLGRGGIRNQRDDRSQLGNLDRRGSSPRRLIATATPTATATPRHRDANAPRHCHDYRDSDRHQQRDTDYVGDVRQPSDTPTARARREHRRTSATPTNTVPPLLRPARRRPRPQLRPRLSTATATQTATPTATATPPFGTLSVSGNLSFGTVKVNSTKSKKLKIKNKGKGSLQVTIGTLVPPFSGAGSGTFNLAKGKTKTVTVKFKPTTKGATPSQILIITSDDPKHPTHNRTAIRRRKVMHFRGIAEPNP